MRFVNKYYFFVVLLLAAAAVLYACETRTSGRGGASTSAASEETVRLRLAIWNSDDAFISFFIDHVRAYGQSHRDVTIEVDPYKSDGDFLQAMRIRSASGQLPDIVQLKPNWLGEFADQLAPLAGAFVDRNKYASKYAVNGSVLAVPTVSFPELVYCRPSIFNALGLRVPTTWPEWLDTLSRIKADGRYIPYAMGGKDGWPDYPFNEFMPLLVSGDERYLSHLAESDAPFGAGSPFYTAYNRIAQMYGAGVTGPSPLDTTWTQASALFVEKKAATLAAGLWYLPAFEQASGGTDDLAAFPLPYRLTETEPLRILRFADQFMGLSSASPHLAEAQDFLAWFYSEDIYRGYLKRAGLMSTLSGIENAIPFLDRFNAAYAPEPFDYIPGDDAYTRLSNAIGLDVKALGQDMMAGRSVDQIAAELNEKWTLARKHGLTERGLEE